MSYYQIMKDIIKDFYNSTKIRSVKISIFILLASIAISLAIYSTLYLAGYIYSRSLMINILDITLLLTLITAWLTFTWILMAWLTNIKRAHQLLCSSVLYGSSVYLYFLSYCFEHYCSDMFLGYALLGIWFYCCVPFFIFYSWTKDGLPTGRHIPIVLGIGIPFATLIAYLIEIS